MNGQSLLNAYELKRDLLKNNKDSLPTLKIFTNSAVLKSIENKFEKTSSPTVSRHPFDKVKKVIQHFI